MFTRPDDLTDAEVAATFASQWGMQVESIEWAAVGFGSHHWRATASGQRWFLTVDDLGGIDQTATELRRGRLHAALTTAFQLHQLGTHFVVAPVLSRRGAVAESIGHRYDLAVYSDVPGESGDYGPYSSSAQRLAVLDCLVELHAAKAVRELPIVDDLSIPSRAGLDAALLELDQRWVNGPFGERARSLLTQHRGPLLRAFKHYDTLLRAVAAKPERFVVTHGEPHRGNVIFGVSGARLIDWDTTLLAPPERDLWALIHEDATIADEYTARSGLTLDADALDLYRLWWDLNEVSLYITEFRSSHVENADTRTGWGGLTQHLDPSRWHSFLS